VFRPVPGGVANERLSAQGVAVIVKSYARRLGLRSGFLTSAARRGASVFKMRDVGRQSMDVLQGYVRDAELFHDHAGAGRPTLHRLREHSMIGWQINGDLA